MRHRLSQSPRSENLSRIHEIAFTPHDFQGTVRLGLYYLMSTTPGPNLIWSRLSRPNHHGRKNPCDKNAVSLLYTLTSETSITPLIAHWNPATYNITHRQAFPRQRWIACARRHEPRASSIRAAPQSVFVPLTRQVYFRQRARAG